MQVANNSAPAMKAARGAFKVNGAFGAKVTLFTTKEKLFIDASIPLTYIMNSRASHPDESTTTK